MLGDLATFAGLLSSSNALTCLYTIEIDSLCAIPILKELLRVYRKQYSFLAVPRKYSVVEKLNDLSFASDDIVLLLNCGISDDLTRAAIFADGRSVSVVLMGYLRPVNLQNVLSENIIVLDDGIISSSIRWVFDYANASATIRNAVAGLRGSSALPEPGLKNAAFSTQTGTDSFFHESDSEASESAFSDAEYSYYSYSASDEAAAEPAGAQGRSSGYTPKNRKVIADLSQSEPLDLQEPSNPAGDNSARGVQREPDEYSESIDHSTESTEQDVGNISDIIRDNSFVVDNDNDDESVVDSLPNHRAITNALDEARRNDVAAGDALGGIDLLVRNRDRDAQDARRTRKRRRRKRAEETPDDTARRQNLQILQRLKTVQTASSTLTDIVRLQILKFPLLDQEFLRRLGTDLSALQGSPKEDLRLKYGMVVAAYNDIICNASLASLTAGRLAFLFYRQLMETRPSICAKVIWYAFTGIAGGVVCQTADADTMHAFREEVAQFLPKVDVYIVKSIKSVIREPSKAGNFHNVTKNDLFGAEFDPPERSSPTSGARVSLASLSQGPASLQLPQGVAAGVAAGMTAGSSLSLQQHTSLDRRMSDLDVYAQSRPFFVDVDPNTFLYRLLPFYESLRLSSYATVCALYYIDSVDIRNKTRQKMLNTVLSHMGIKVEDSLKSPVELSRKEKIYITSQYITLCVRARSERFAEATVPNVVFSSVGHEISVFDYAHLILGLLALPATVDTLAALSELTRLGPRDIVTQLQLCNGRAGADGLPRSQAIIQHAVHVAREYQAFVVGQMERLNAGMIKSSPELPYYYVLSLYDIGKPILHQAVAAGGGAGADNKLSASIFLRIGCEARAFIALFKRLSLEKRYAGSLCKQIESGIVSAGPLDAFKGLHAYDKQAILKRRSISSILRNITLALLCRGPANTVVVKLSARTDFCGGVCGNCIPELRHAFEVLRPEFLTVVEYVNEEIAVVDAKDAANISGILRDILQSKWKYPKPWGSRQ